MKLFSFLIAFVLVACSTLGKPTPEGTIKSFYENYMKSNKVVAPLSASFSNLIKENKRVCDRYAGTDICGWGANGDVYLNTQESSPNLNAANSGLKVTPLDGNRVKVSFNVYPEQKSDYYQRNITYEMISENGIWVINDIIYGKDGRATKEIRKQTRYFSKKH